MNKKALFYKIDSEKLVQCELCSHLCVINEDQLGLCGVRRNMDGDLFTENYAQCSSCAVDPVEKKPLYHFYPGMQILSLGSIGCNFTCSFCQNWRISQDVFTITKTIFPEQIIQLAQEHDIIGVAYTYNEPSIWYEFVIETAKNIQDAGYKNVLVTNGYINKAPMQQLLPYIDALNIDIKSMDESFYKEYCKAGLKPVLETAVLAKQNAHVEITNLVIPTLNDKEEDFDRLGKWISENLGCDTPLHISRYFPQYNLKIEHTPVDTLRNAKKILLEHLDFVYIGNVSDGDDNTYCKECKEVLVERKGYSVSGVYVSEKSCVKCNSAVNLIN